jgi:hypothetical protein
MVRWPAGTWTGDGRGVPSSEVGCGQQCPASTWSRGVPDPAQLRLRYLGFMLTARASEASGESTRRVRGLQGVPSRLGHVHAYQTISSRRALSAMLKNQ